jgi:hypothetical protein
MTMENSFALNSLTALTGQYQGKPYNDVCPNCMTNIAELVTVLKCNPNTEQFDNAYKHVRYACPVCLDLIKRYYINDFGKWVH